MPRALWWTQGVLLFLMSEVPLHMIYAEESYRKRVSIHKFLAMFTAGMIYYY